MFGLTNKKICREKHFPSIRCIIVGCEAFMDFRVIFLKNTMHFLYFRLTMKSVACFVTNAMKTIHPATHADRNKCVGI